MSAHSRVRDLIRGFNKHALNPLLMRFAGRGTFYAAVIHHVGRSSGREYATPVVADPIEGGFLIPLPYGADTDWCRNVLAAGGATIDRHGETFSVVQPEVIGADSAIPMLPSRVRASRQRVRPKQFLLLHGAAAGAPSAGAGVGVGVGGRCWDRMSLDGGLLSRILVLPR